VTESADFPAIAPLVILGEHVRVTNAPPGLVVARADRPASPEPTADRPPPPRRRSSLLDVRFHFAALPEDSASAVVSPVAPVVAAAPAPVPTPTAAPLDAPPPALAAADRDQAEFLSVDAFAPGLGESPASRETTATFVTETMAELYLRQGLPDRALEIYRQLVDRTPTDARLRARLAELGAPEPEPAADAMLAAVSFDGFALPTPRSPSGADDARSARDWFGALARRGIGQSAAPGRPAPRASSADLAAAIAALSTEPLPLGGANDHAFDDWLRGPA